MASTALYSPVPAPGDAVRARATGRGALARTGRRGRPRAPAENAMKPWRSAPAGAASRDTWPTGPPVRTTRSTRSSRARACWPATAPGSPRPMWRRPGHEWIADRGGGPFRGAGFSERGTLENLRRGLAAPISAQHRHAWRTTDWPYGPRRTAQFAAGRPPRRPGWRRSTARSATRARASTAARRWRRASRRRWPGRRPSRWRSPPWPWSRTTSWTARCLRRALDGGPPGRTRGALRGGHRRLPVDRPGPRGSRPRLRRVRGGTDGDFTDSVLTAVNMGRDADTTAAVAGALVGATRGVHAIPADWATAIAPARGTCLPTMAGHHVLEVADLLTRRPPGKHRRTVGRRATARHSRPLAPARRVSSRTGCRCGGGGGAVSRARAGVGADGRHGVRRGARGAGGGRVQWERAPSGSRAGSRRGVPRGAALRPHRGAASRARRAETPPAGRPPGTGPPGCRSGRAGSPASWTPSPSRTRPPPSPVPIALNQPRNRCASALGRRRVGGVRGGGRTAGGGRQRARRPEPGPPDARRDRPDLERRRQRGRRGGRPRPEVESAVLPLRARISVRAGLGNLATGLRPPATGRQPALLRRRRLRTGLRPRRRPPRRPAPRRRPRRVRRPLHQDGDGVHGARAMAAALACALDGADVDACVAAALAELPRRRRSAATPATPWPSRRTPKRLRPRPAPAGTASSTTSTGYGIAAAETVPVALALATAARGRIAEAVPAAACLSRVADSAPRWPAPSPARSAAARRSPLRPGGTPAAPCPAVYCPGSPAPTWSNSPVSWTPRDRPHRKDEAPPHDRPDYSTTRTPRRARHRRPLWARCRRRRARQPRSRATPPSRSSNATAAASTASSAP